MSETEEKPENGAPPDQAELIVKKVKNNRYVAPVIAVALISLTVLSYFGKLHEAWHEARGWFGDKQQAEQQKKVKEEQEQHERDLETSAYSLAQGLRTIERFKFLDSLHLKLSKATRQQADATVKQAMVNIGVYLGSLNLTMNYADLDYSVVHQSDDSLAYLFLAGQIDRLHDDRLRSFYDIGYLSWLFIYTATDYDKTIKTDFALQALKRLNECNQRVNISTIDVNQAIRDTTSQYLTATDRMQLAVIMNQRDVEILTYLRGNK